jgi:DNA-binding MarR family transcriptional regulator
MANSGPDPVQQIADALSRLRGHGPKPPWGEGRTPNGRGLPPWMDAAHGPFAGHGPHGSQGGGGAHGSGGGAHGYGPHSHGRGRRDVDGDGSVGDGERRDTLPGWQGRMAGMARLRLLDALATASDPLTVSALAEAIGVDQPRASRLVQQGVDHGLVRREADPDDARRTRVALTEAGAAIASRFRDARRGSIEDALASFTVAERAELARLLTKLADFWQG